MSATSRGYARWVRKLVPPVVRQRIRLLSWNALARRDLSQLSRRMPWLYQFAELSFQAQEEIRPYYQHYVTNVSKAEMAISWNLALLLFVFCHSIKPKKILDLGSGFSSVLFRLYRRNYDPQCSVVSIDDSPIWLETTRRVLGLHGLSDERLSNWSEFIQENRDAFDLVSYDLGYEHVRCENFSKIPSLANEGGFIVVDDAQWMDYQILIKRARRGTFKCYSLRTITLDGWGRYSLLLVR